MNEMVLKEVNNQHIIYLYKPEGRGDPGEIEYSFESKEAKLKRLASENSPYYYNHAILAVEKCVKKNNLPITFMNAWH
jgi:hypothetical protein